MCQTICPYLCLRKYGIHFFSKKGDPNHWEPLPLNPASVSTLMIDGDAQGSLGAALRAASTGTMGSARRGKGLGPAPAWVPAPQAPALPGARPK